MRRRIRIRRRLRGSEGKRLGTLISDIGLPVDAKRITSGNIASLPSWYL